MKKSASDSIEVTSEDMELLNFDSYASDYNENPRVTGHFLMPAWPFRMIVNGPSGCGKSNLVFNMITKYLYFDKLYVYAKDTDEDKYQMLKDFMTEVAVQRGVPTGKIFFMSNDPKDIPSPQAYDPKYQNLVIYDDMVVEKNQEHIEEMYINGRKRNCSPIYISQSYFDIPKKVRMNANYVALFGIDNEDEVKAIRRKHGARLTIDQFMEKFHEITDERHSFMLLDNVTPDLPLAFRKGFDNVLDTSTLKKKQKKE